MSDYRWNGFDPYSSFGLNFSPGLDNELMKAPRLKDNGLSINWAGDNGTERYFGARKFESRTLSIPCTISASSESSLMTKYQALVSFLVTTGEFNFDVVSRNKRYKLSYIEMPSFSKLTNFKGRSRMAISFTLTLADDHPTENFTIT